MDQRIIDLYDRFTHGFISRRDFLDRTSVMVGSSTAAAALLPILRNDYAKAAVVEPADPRLTLSDGSYDAPGGRVNGYLARLKGAPSKRPSVIVVHENRGLNPHIQDIARRLALEGFLAYAVDLLSTSGGTPGDEDKATQMIKDLNLDQTTKQLVAAVGFLERHPESNGKVGVVGFCWGGGMVNRLAQASPDLAAAVAYYGPVPPLDKVAAIKAPLLLHYAGLDNFVNPKVPDYEAALKADHKTYQAFTYPNVNHAFNNDTAGPRYNKEAADLAWQRTVAFLHEYLGVAQPG